MTDYHLLPDGDHWKLTTELGERIITGLPTKEAGLMIAIDNIRDKGGSLKIHRADGTIEEERSYPRLEDPKGTPG
jgi:hypothetical protein